MKIIKYNHHGVDVSVIEHLKGKHSENCLCYSNCLHFKPGSPQNCEIAQSNFELCLKYNVVTPVFECPKYNQVKVSFDFDDTLDKEHVQDYAKMLVENMVEVHIVTARVSDKYYPLPVNNDLYNIAQKLGIKREHVHFTDGDWKVGFFIRNTGFVWHLDNDYRELVKISRAKECKTYPISVLTTTFTTKCNRILNRHIYKLKT